MSTNDLPVLGVIAIGGGIGAEARYGMSRWLPPQPHHIPWSTLYVNAVGCFLIGVLMVLITEVWAAHRLLRPFLGVGVLGGFTTFSTYTVEVRGLVESGALALAFAYLAGAVVIALAAVVVGVGLTRTAAGITEHRRSNNA